MPRKGFAVAVTVVDRAASVEAVQGTDNAGQHALEAGQSELEKTSLKHSALAVARLVSLTCNAPPAGLDPVIDLLK